DRYVEYGQIGFLHDFKKSTVYRILLRINEHYHYYRGSDTSAWLTGNMISSVRRNRDKPLFLWAHYIDPHTPLRPPREYLDIPEDEKDEALRFGALETMDFKVLKEEDSDKIIPLYEAETRYVDHQLGRFFDVLAKEGLLDNTLIIITADHGEEFFEHGFYGHGRSHYNELIHIPMIVYFPDRDSGVSPYPVALIDIFPSILDYVGIEDDFSLSGESIVGPTALGDSGEGKLVFLDETNVDGTTKSVRDARYTLIRTGETEYEYTMIDNYIHHGPEDIVTDPDPDMFARFKAELDRLAEMAADERAGLGGGGAGVTIDKGTEDKIKGLGYF
ncbi:MAG: sulfatase-like hydrolase/transferase, partial [Candidatus Dadabacteria bacterium]|nr:sulfatase-like hydrolase/transferase [Candidatus Dadabacteria bacterium]